MPFRFLATIVARIAGNEDADFMAEERAELPPDALEVWLTAKAKAAEAANGATHIDPSQATEGTSAGDEGGGVGA